MKIVTLVEMTDADIGEAISEWAKKKFKKKNVGDISLEAIDLGTNAPVSLTDCDGYVIRAKFELSDKEKDDEDGSDVNR